MALVRRNPKLGQQAHDLPVTLGSGVGTACLALVAFKRIEVEVPVVIEIGNTEATIGMKMAKKIVVAPLEGE